MKKIIILSLVSLLPLINSSQIAASGPEYELYDQVLQRIKDNEANTTEIKILNEIMYNDNSTDIQKSDASYMRAFLEIKAHDDNPDPKMIKYAYKLLEWVVKKEYSNNEYITNAKKAMAIIDSSKVLKPKKEQVS